MHIVANGGEVEALTLRGCVDPVVAVVSVSLCGWVVGCWMLSRALNAVLLCDPGVGQAT